MVRLAAGLRSVRSKPGGPGAAMAGSARLAGGAEIDHRKAGQEPELAQPARPKERLSLWRLLKTLPTNSLGIFDEELFEQPVVIRRYGLVTVCFLNDPAGLKRVLQDNWENYPRFRALQRIFEAEVATGTLASECDVWARHRRIAVPAIDHRSILPDVDAMIAIAEGFADEVLARHGRRKKPVDVQKLSNELVLRMVNLIATGGDPGAAPILKWLSAVPRKPRPIDLIPKPKWLSRLIVRRNLDPERVAADQLLQSMIGERIAPGYDGPRDLLWRLANFRDRQDGKPLSPIEARDEVASLLAAADATVRALAWTWYVLSQRPEAERKLWVELDALDGAPLTVAQLRQLPYLGRLLDEVMRLYPPIPAIIRQSLEPDELCGKTIPKDAMVVISPYVTHRHKALWDEPERFDPERFTDEARAARPKLAYLPFSVGPHVCPGASLSAIILQIAVAALARRLRFELAPEKPVVPFGGISLEPRGGLWMRPRRRTETKNAAPEGGV